MNKRPPAQAPTMNEWQEALKEIQPVPEHSDSKSVAELAEIWKCGISTASRRAKQLVKNGAAEATYKLMVRTCNGYPGLHRTPSYRLLKWSKKGTKP